MTPDAASPDIVLVGINARYSHAALGLRYLLANMGPLRPRTLLKEFVIQDGPEKIAEYVLSLRPRIVAFSVAIWNRILVSDTAEILKKLTGDLTIIVGGPEYRWAAENPEFSDVLIRGEADEIFPEICSEILAGNRVPALVDPELPDLSAITLPYDEYDEQDLAHRLISVEASRGCPFGCEFCLSSREEKVRRFPVKKLLASLDGLISRGCRSFRFIDRTFNLDRKVCETILDFFYERWPRDEEGVLRGPVDTRQADPGARRGSSFFLHFETVPDRFDEELIESLARFPAGGIQLEMGIQTLNPRVGENISRKVDTRLCRKNITALKNLTGVHIHADLIIGLPGEDEKSFAESFDGLYGMGPDEIQVGILKLLPGAPIARHSLEYHMVYNPKPPYDILCNRDIPFLRMQELKRLARYYDLFVNSGRFSSTMERMMNAGDSPFQEFDDFSSWLWSTLGREHGIALNKQYGLVLDYCVNVMSWRKEDTGKSLAEDFLRKGIERHLPEVLRSFAEQARS